MQIVFEHEQKHHGIHENIGFAVMKIVGDATCKFYLDFCFIERKYLLSTVL